MEKTQNLESLGAVTHTHTPYVYRNGGEQKLHIRK